jgi:hypothetical protein
MEPMIKGYIIQNTSRFMLEDAEVRPRLERSLVQDVQQRLLAFNPTGWYPRSEIIRLNRAIAATQLDEASAYAALVRTGEFAGRAAIGTFMKLLFKMLTPKMFASKFPDFFKRDHQGGEAAVAEVSDRRVVLVARDIAGFDHFGPNTVGFAAVAFTAMGLKGLKVTCAPWSLAEPGPAETRFTATWD